MMVLPVKLILCVCLWFGIHSLSILVLAAESSSAQTQLDPELFTQAIIHAKEISQSLGYNAGQSLVQQLQEGNIEALYTVAQSLNSRNENDDRIISVQIWHALADGTASHVQSAVSLGFSYSEVDKELALQYFIQASRGKEDDENSGPHQAALYNAGRLFLELGDAASSLAYIRACANTEKEYPEYATEQLTQTCTVAYNTLSTQIQSETITPPGIEDAAQIFIYAAIDEFPLPTTKEFKLYEKGMGYLDKYAQLVREGGDTSAVKHLKAAMKELEQLQKKAGDDMSELQKYLLKIIVGRVQLLMTADGDEL